MSLGDLGLIDYESNCLLIDGDLIVYQACCVFDEDDDQSRRMIIKKINEKIEKLMMAAECDTYILFLTTKFNFRDFLVPDYKYNRSDAERPINLAWTKHWAVSSLNSNFRKYLEADDLLGIYMTKMNNVVLWSLDKDLRQIPGMHLDNATGKVVEVTYEGILRVDYRITEAGKKKEKVYFDGNIGFYYQLLVGDPTDYILGCAKREEAVRKSGKDKGQTYSRRKGVGSKAALGVIATSVATRGNKSLLDSALEAVAREYQKVCGATWKEDLETQANLLFMVRYQYGSVIKRWTYDKRDEYFDIDKGEIIDDFTPPTD